MRHWNSDDYWQSRLAHGLEVLLVLVLLVEDLLNRIIGRSRSDGRRRDRQDFQRRWLCWTWIRTGPRSVDCGRRESVASEAS